jgi:hypothetical protein
MAEQTVESLLLSNERDFVIGLGGRKVGFFPFSLLCFPPPANLDLGSLL